MGAPGEGFCRDAHAASLSLEIFTLWRTSTGKARWNSTVVIAAVTGEAAPNCSSSSLNRVTSSAVAGNLPGRGSITITGRWCRTGPTPTRAARHTPRRRSKVPPQGSADSGPGGVGDRSAARPPRQVVVDHAHAVVRDARLVPHEVRPQDRGDRLEQVQGNAGAEHRRAQVQRRLPPDPRRQRGAARGAGCLAGRALREARAGL